MYKKNIAVEADEEMITYRNLRSHSTGFGCTAVGVVGIEFGYGVAGAAEVWIC